MLSNRLRTTSRALWIKKMPTRSWLRMLIRRLKLCKRSKMILRMSILHLRVHILTMSIELKLLNWSLQQILLLLLSLKKSNPHFQLNNHPIFLKKNLIILITWKHMQLLSPKFLPWSKNLQIMKVKRRMTSKPQNLLTKILSPTSISSKRNWLMSKKKSKIITVNTRAPSNPHRNLLVRSNPNKEMIKIALAVLNHNRTKIIPMSKDMSHQSMDSRLMKEPMQDILQSFNLNKEKMCRISLDNHRKLVLLILKMERWVISYLRINRKRILTWRRSIVFGQLIRLRFKIIPTP